MSNGYLI